MRLLPLALLLAACADAPAPSPGPDSDALTLLAHVDGEALADAFAALDAAGYTARLAVSGDAPASATVAVAPGGAVSVADATGEVEAPRLGDVVAQALSADPPYLDPAAREAYRTAVVGDTTVGGVAFRLVEAELTDASSELGVRYVRAAVADGGLVGALVVERRSASALFDEASRVAVALAPHAGGWVPRTVETVTTTDVPLADPRRVAVSWTVEAVGGRSL